MMRIHDDAPPAVFLDLSRLVSRLHKGAAFTGIDRVELSYLKRFLTQDGSLYGVIRTALGAAILSREGMRCIFNWAARQEALPVKLGFWARYFVPKDPARVALERHLRRFTISRVALGRVGVAVNGLARCAVYLNVGHSNLSNALLSGFARAGVRSVIMLHDVIPLTHPRFTRLDPQRAFVEKIKAVSKFADMVVHLRHASRAENDAQLARYGRVPPGVVLPLGVDIARSAETLAPAAGDVPYFVAIGTIEPRKNIPLLLDVWDQLNALGGIVPRLYLIGGRGWADPALFARIARTAHVTLLSGLDDDARNALLSQARALLFPSFAEGFGLPPYEAAALGVPVVASDLAVLREGLDDTIFLSPTDVPAWLQHVKSLSEAPLFRQHIRVRAQIPSWDTHFRGLDDVIHEQCGGRIVPTWGEI